MLKELLLKKKNTSKFKKKYFKVPSNFRNLLRGHLFIPLTVIQFCIYINITLPCGTSLYFTEDTWSMWTLCDTCVTFYIKYRFLLSLILVVAAFLLRKTLCTAEGFLWTFCFQQLTSNTTISRRWLGLLENMLSPRNLHNVKRNLELILFVTSLKDNTAQHNTSNQSHESCISSKDIL